MSDNPGYETFYYWCRHAKKTHDHKYPVQCMKDDKYASKDHCLACKKENHE